MAKMFARLMHSDGKYHYGQTVNPGPHLGPLFLIDVQDGVESELPVAPDGAATQAEHDKSMDALRKSGRRVTIKALPD